MNLLTAIRYCVSRSNLSSTETLYSHRPFAGLEKEMQGSAKTNISPENQWLEDEISFWSGPCFGDMFVFGGVLSFFFQLLWQVPHCLALSLWSPSPLKIILRRLDAAKTLWSYQTTCELSGLNGRTSLNLGVTSRVSTNVMTRRTKHVLFFCWT